MLQIFLGYDTREPVAYHVAAHSIWKRASRPISITPLALDQLSFTFTRPRDPRQSTDFSFSRFLVPSLCGFEGWSLFADCDIVVLDDVVRLRELRDERYAVQVVKHDHVPKGETKFLGQPQTSYEKKNWSSVMLFQNAACRALMPDYINSAAGLDLHRFRWLGDDGKIGALPARWNHLVDYDQQKPLTEISLLHYTSGGPWFEDYRHCGYADVWLREHTDLSRL